MKVLKQISAERYEGEGFVMAREYDSVDAGDNPMDGRWVLRDPEGKMIDCDKYRNDLAPRHGFELDGDM